VQRTKRVSKKVQPVPNRKPAPQPYQKSGTPKKSVQPKRRKNPFETTIEEMLKELEMPEPTPRKPKPKPQLFDKEVSKPKVVVKKTPKKVTVSTKKVKRRKKINLQKKMKTFDFNALDAVIYSEIINRKY